MNGTTFLTFDEAVAAAEKEPGTEFIGLRYAPPYTHAEMYTVRVDSDEPDQVQVLYEGGELFSMGGEEDFYDADDAPDDARASFYARRSELGDGAAGLMGMTSEYVLSQLLPGLPEARTYSSESAFIQAAGEAYRSFWRQS